MSVNVFGRLRAPVDGRDFRFLMRAAMPQVAAAAVVKPTPRSRAYNDGPLLDQGDVPECVGYSTRGFLDGAPIMSKPTVGPSAHAIYRLAQDLDEWPGHDYEGTSVRGAMKALTRLKEISSYVWGQSVEDLISWTNGGYGTVVVGTNWYAEMSDVDRTGFMHEPAGSLTTPLGGHAWRVNWFDVKRQAFLMRNSWGPYFGIEKQGIPSGYAYVRRDFMARLLHEDGEIAAPVQVRIVPARP